MARWITLKKAPYNHYFTRNASMVIREPGEHYVKDEVADRAVKLKYAVEGKESERATTAKKPRKKADDAADTGKSDGVGAESVSADGSADNDAAVDAAG